MLEFVSLVPPISLGSVELTVLRLEWAQFAKLYHIAHFILGKADAISVESRHVPSRSTRRDWLQRHLVLGNVTHHRL